MQRLTEVGSPSVDALHPRICCSNGLKLCIGLTTPHFGSLHFCGANATIRMKDTFEVALRVEEHVNLRKPLNTMFSPLRGTERQPRWTLSIDLVWEKNFV